MSIDIVSSDFTTHRTFSFKDDSIIFPSFTKNETIPICEVIEIKRGEIIKNYNYITFTLSNAKTFTAKMKDNDYIRIYESFIKNGNRPNFISLPKIEKHFVSRNKSLVLFIVLVVIPFIISTNKNHTTPSQSTSNANNESSQKSIQTKRITPYEFGRICQYAIALDFGKNPSIVKVKKPYDISKNIVAVGYTRKDDNTKWNFECKISDDNDRILWRAIPGTKIDYIGRWRDGTNGGEGNDSIISYSVVNNEIIVNLKNYNGENSKGKNMSFLRKEI